MPGFNPSSCKYSTKASTVGVFPVPPTVTLPTTTTGTGACQVFFNLMAYSIRLRAAKQVNNTLRGVSHHNGHTSRLRYHQVTTFSLTQHHRIAFDIIVRMHLCLPATHGGCHVL